MQATRKRSAPKDSVTHAFEPRGSMGSSTRTPRPQPGSWGWTIRGHGPITASSEPPQSVHISAATGPPTCNPWCYVDTLWTGLTPAGLSPMGQYSIGHNSRARQTGPALLPTLKAWKSLLLESSEAWRRPQQLVLHHVARCTHRHKMRADGEPAA